MISLFVQNGTETDIYEGSSAQEFLPILEGLLIALDNTDVSSLSILITRQPEAVSTMPHRKAS